MTIVITGASGFIGTNFINFISKFGYEIFNYDINPPRDLTQLKYWKNVDILDEEVLSINLLADKPNYIVHFAARTDLNEKVNLSGYNVNIEGVENLMRLASNLEGLNRIIVASSMLVCKAGYFPSSFEDYCPNSLYGESKVLTEKIVKNYDCNWVIVRPTSIWGPWFKEPYFDFFNLVIKGWYFNLPKEVSSTKTYGFVENICLQVHSIMLAPVELVNHNFYYLGDSVPINVSVWADKIRYSLGKRPLPIIPVSLLRFAALVGDFLHKYFHIYKYPMSSFRYKNMTTDNVIASIAETNNFVDTNKFISLEVGITKTLEWINKQSK